MPDTAAPEAVADQAADRLPPAWRRALTREEIRDLLRMRDWRSWTSLAVDWGLVFAAMAMVARWPNPLTIVLALFVIGARQLGFAILMHEAAHRSLFADRRVNDWVGNWLCAYPIWSDTRPYRPYHLQHHAKNWTAEDPDIGLAMPFPITPASLRRKVWRDLSGQTGWKRLKATVRRDLGMSEGRVKRNFDAGMEAFKGVAITNAVLLAILWLAGHPWLYLLWVVSWMTTYSLVMRIRSIAEHAMIPEPADELRNTRTTIARWWERLFLAPNRVNYHLEHHLLMTVPHYHLPRLHRLLRDRGVLGGACVVRGYPAVLALAASRTT
ncbi:MAG: fatty acid desaturase family protein [bacterium]|nr:fatty acid desaturase family protein [bacterium]